MNGTNWSASASFGERDYADGRREGAVMGIDVAGASTQMSARHMEQSLEAALSSTRRSLKRPLPLDRAATASSAVSLLHAAGYEAVQS